MKKLFVLLFAALISCSLNSTAQAPATNFLGTKTLYKPAALKYTPVPAGYKAVFINHVGRHGARHLTKEVNTAFAYTTLFKADAANALTVKGKQLLQMVVALDKVEKGNVKSISAEGIAELQDIGQRMYTHNPTVFATGANLNVTETKEIRTKQSADAFLAGLKKNLNKEPVIKEYIDDTNLRFYDLSPVYDKFKDDGDWLKYREAIAKQQNLPYVNDAIAQRVFTPVFLKTLDNAGKEKFVSDIFGFATITYSLKQEIQQAGLQPAATAFITLFTPQEIKTLSILDLADDFYQKGPGTNNNGIQVRVAAPLLANFIKTTDDFMKTGSFNAQLRFAHAETISPFAALLGISIADVATKTTNIGAAWQASNVIPLSANIQWIFYKNTANNYLVKIMLNEKEAHITGLNAKSFPYYKWADVRKLYLAKLQSLHLGLDDDMNAYLQNIK